MTVTDDYEYEEDLRYPPAGPGIPSVESGEFTDYDADPDTGDPGDGSPEVDPDQNDDDQGEDNDG